MSTDDFYSDKYEHYEEQFNPLLNDRQERRKRKPKVNHAPKKTDNQVINEIADTLGLEGGFNTTYQPARYESGWLLESLRTFFEQELITDVLTSVKGGKEATVYCCQAHPITGAKLLAAKVYRPRMFRNLRNDKMYRQGRDIITLDGQLIKKNESRVMRALGKKTSYGAEVQHTSWLMHEYKAIERLHRAGAAVPQPLSVSENAILMSYFGDAQMAAPALNEINLEPDEAPLLFREVLRNIELILQHNLIHGDLSAYNILYWEGEITFIDFPQIVNCHTNSESYFILRRDIERVCQYFQQQGVQCDAAAIMDDMWSRYVEVGPANRAADLSRLTINEDEDDEEAADE